MMKARFIFILSGFALILSLLSCVKEPSKSLSESEVFCAEMNFTAGIADALTKTNRADNGSVLWSSEEEINVFKGSSISGKFTSQNTEPAKSVTFTGTLSGTYSEGPDSYWAIYPYSSGNRCDGGGVTLSVSSVQTSDGGSFKDGVFPSVAHSSDNNLFFYNICGGFKISLSRGDIVEITLEGNNKEALAGKVYLSGAVGERPFVSIKEGITKITLTPSSGKYFKEGVFYYFTVLPTELSNGFTMSFKTDSQIGVLKSDNSLSISHSVFCRKEIIDSYVTEWSEYSHNNVYGSSGVYLGILGFNQTITSCPITLLTTENRDSFATFINNLTTANGTLLYYGVENSITALQGGSYPEDLETVTVVSFTDGLDQGSLMMSFDYLSDEEYLDALNSKISSERVSGLPISTYSVGVMGSDVSDQTKFRNNLDALASMPENVYELSNISELQSKFEEIANCISVSMDYSYNVALSIPGLSDGTRIRFTFDGKQAINSKQYIEGTFNLRYRSLDEVVYVGLTSTNGETITGSVVDEIFVKFTFNNLRDSGEGTLNTNRIDEWYWSSDAWQKNTEFDGDTNSDINIDAETKSAAIFLVLDCSSSLGNDFNTMKTAANEFVNKLYAVEHRPQSVKLNRQNLVMAIDDEVQLSATVFPITAQVASHTWSSSDNAVATVTEDGFVKAIAPGETMVSFTTHNNVTASCSVVVSELDIKKEWGPANPDFTYTGLYFGMLVFNKDYYRYKICRLDDAKKAEILTFIDSIPVKNGTVMCSAADEALSEMSKPVFPVDISKVTLVSFTDGLDQGSVMKSDRFSSTDEYLDYLHEKILTERIQDVPISAYSVGVQGNDLVAHSNSLSKLASLSSNVFSLKKQSDLSDKMSEIANSADVSVDVITYYSYNLTITIPGVSNGARVRFTFDDVNDPNDSRLFIEGTFNLRDRSLSDISFFGFESSMPSSVAGVVDGIFVSFEFSDVAKSDKSTLSLANIKEWTSPSGSTTWQINSEFNTGNVVSTSLTNKTVKQNSALVYLVLDNSSSVSSSNYFGTMKNCIKDLVNSLSLKFVGSIQLSPTKLTLYAGGKSKKVRATVLPNTAVIKDLRWTSSDDGIARVDESGNVIGIRQGQCTIKATANNGVYATCSVVVEPPFGIHAIDLGLSVKWATNNIGADIDNVWGDYYAWGETEPYYELPSSLPDYYHFVWRDGKSAGYAFSSYKWCEGSSTSLTKYNNTDSSYGIVDNKTQLEEADDVAHAKLGGDWRMPTQGEFSELLRQCTWSWTKQNGWNGCKVTGPNGNSIFLPAAGKMNGTNPDSMDSYGFYWTSSLHSYPPSARDVYFSYDKDKGLSKNDLFASRCLGGSVRPVCDFDEFLYVKKITLSPSSLTMMSGDVSSISMTISPPNAMDKSVLWKSSDSSVATVDESGLVTAVALGTATITVMALDGSGKTATCSIQVKEPEIPDLVDLGLSVKWASFNLGASAPEEYGNYYAWGETGIKSNYVWNTYKWCKDGSNTQLTKYCTNKQGGTVDNKTILDLEDDAARAQLGGTWRMPTDEEWTELRSNCTWTWTTINGVYGRKVTSNKKGYKDKWIFLPAAGSRNGTALSGAGSDGRYWSASLSTSYQTCAFTVEFSSSAVNRYDDVRYSGLSVRPVSE